MTGPQNYEEAERLLLLANIMGHQDPQRGAGILAAAQVHATLALAAATALFLPIDPASERRPQDEDAWVEVAGTKPAGGAA